MKTYLKNSKDWNGRYAYITTETKGAGSFLDPPGYHSHFFGIVEGIDRGNGYQGYPSVDYYLNNNDVPKYVKAQIKNIIKDCKPQLTEKWIKEVLSYFKNSYSVDSINRNVNNDLLEFFERGNKFNNSKSHYFKRDINKNLGIMHIRSFFPDYIPTFAHKRFMVN
jgi:hypothetical protein